MINKYFNQIKNIKVEILLAIIANFRYLYFCLMNGWIDWTYPKENGLGMDELLVYFPRSANFSFPLRLDSLSSTLENNLNPSTNAPFIGEFLMSPFFELNLTTLNITILFLRIILCTFIFVILINSKEIICKTKLTNLQKILTLSLIIFTFYIVNISNIEQLLNLNFRFIFLSLLQDNFLTRFHNYIISYPFLLLTLNALLRISNHNKNNNLFIFLISLLISFTLFLNIYLYTSLISLIFLFLIFNFKFFKSYKKLIIFLVPNLFAFLYYLINAYALSQSSKNVLFYSRYGLTDFSLNIKSIIFIAITLFIIKILFERNFLFSDSLKKIYLFLPLSALLSCSGFLIFSAILGKTIQPFQYKTLFIIFSGTSLSLIDFRSLFNKKILKSISVLFITLLICIEFGAYKQLDSKISLESNLTVFVNMLKKEINSDDIFLSYFYDAPSWSTRLRIKSYTSFSPFSNKEDDLMIKQAAISSYFVNGKNENKLSESNKLDIYLNHLKLNTNIKQDYRKFNESIQNNIGFCGQIKSVDLFILNKDNQSDSIDKLKACNYVVKKLVSNDAYSAIFIDHEKNK